MDWVLLDAAVFSLFGMSVLLLKKGGGGAWVEFLCWPRYESVVFWRGLSLLWAEYCG